MEIEIRNALDFLALESQIRKLIERYDLDQILFGIRQSSDKLHPFVAAGLSVFAARFARPPIIRGKDTNILPWKKIAPIAHLVTIYLLADPFSFDPPVVDDYHGSTLIPLFLRLVGNQFPYDVDIFGQYARSLILFRDLPRQLTVRANIPKFDFAERFYSITRANVENFIDIAYVAYVAADSRPGFSGGFYDKARVQGMHLPDDQIIRHVLDQLAGDQWQISEMYEKYKQPDRRFSANDYNPLFVTPLIRPWRKQANMNLDDDYLMAPLPNLILTRLSEGIYHQMFSKYRDDFSQYFGHIFEAYAGEVLRQSLPQHSLVSESKIRQSYPMSMGKVPDWVVIEGETAILIECKATGFSRKALATADVTAVDHSIKQIIIGLIQLHEFKDACLKHRRGLERFRSCTTFKNLILTFEPFYIVNSRPFRDVILEILRQKLGNTPLNVWHVLAINELEKFQMHLAAGVQLTDVLNALDGTPLNTVYQDLHNQTGRTYKDCFLYGLDEEIYQRFNVT